MVSNLDNNNLTPIDTSTNTPGAPATVGLAPDGLAITPDQAPQALLSVTPGQPGLPTSFDASAKVAFGTVASYQWAFGDGATAMTTTPTTTHTYASAANYTATVTETSTGGTSTTRVFTGQTMSRNGSAAARSSKAFAVTDAVSVPATGAGWLIPAGGSTVLAGITLLLLAVSRRRED